MRSLQKQILLDLLLKSKIRKEVLKKTCLARRVTYFFFQGKNPYILNGCCKKIPFHETFYTKFPSVIQTRPECVKWL
jgi:hypothetical protein